MARTQADLPRMQNQPPGRRVTEPAPPIVPGEVDEPKKGRRSRMMRQYDLIEKVKSYNPNADEDLLNRAYVYAMKAHGTQTRASGDPYFSHPIEVAGILTDMKLDSASIVTALLHDTVEDTVATLDDMVSGDAPGILALMAMVGMSMLG